VNIIVSSAFVFGAGLYRSCYWPFRNNSTTESAALLDAFRAYQNLYPARRTITAPGRPAVSPDHLNSVSLADGSESLIFAPRTLICGAAEGAK